MQKRKKQKWNHSLDDNVRTCARRVFYKDRYACHSSTKESARHEAFLLKQALDLPSWRGRLVHLVIKNWIIPSLQEQLWPDFNLARKSAVELVHSQAAFSRSGRYRNTTKTAAGNSYCVLRADLLGSGLANDQLEEIYTGVVDALTVLEHHHSEVLQRAQRARRVLAEKEIRFYLDEEILVEAIPDLIFCELNNRGIIVDWKVWEGTKGTARDQLHAYAFAALHCNWWREFSVDNFELIEANLITGDMTSYELKEAELDAVDDRIFTGVELLQPIFERKMSDCQAEDFPSADSPNACQYCRVLEVCNGSFARKSEVQSLPLELFQARGA